MDDSVPSVDSQQPKATSGEPLGLTYEQMPAGWSLRTAGRTIRDYDVSAFVNLAGIVEPLFLDDRAAASTGHDRRLVPGALVFTFAEGLVIQSNTLRDTGVAFLGADIEMKAPVYVGDTIEVEITVIERRLTSANDRGIVRTENLVRRGDDVVLVYRPLRMIRCADQR